VLEALLTFVLVLVVLLVTGRAAAPGFAGLAIGLTLTAVHLIGIPLTGTSVNPARSVGPALFAGGVYLEHVWLFVLAPLVGAVLAVGAARVLNAPVLDETSERATSAPVDRTGVELPSEVRVADAPDADRPARSDRRER
jgi:aquaporin Z